MSVSLKSHVPSPVKRLVRSFLGLPSVDSLGRAARIASKRILDASSRDQSRHGLAMMGDMAVVEELFARSEDNFEAIVGPYVSEFRWSLGRIYNEFFESVDAELYYAMIRRYRPELIIEVGSGSSTGFAWDAMQANGQGQIISIDPQPRRELPRQVEHLCSRVEDVERSLFGRLSRNDVLFIDSSHTTEEALFHTEQILPYLDDGVIVHHHDVLMPYVRYHMNDAQMFGEPDVLLEFYLRHRNQYEVLLSTSYVRYKNPNLMARLIRSYRWWRARVPGSLWTVKNR